MRYFRLLFIVGAMLVVVACGQTAPEEEPAFETTPVPGTPEFLATPEVPSDAYPEPQDADTAEDAYPGYPNPAANVEENAPYPDADTSQSSSDPGETADDSAGRTMTALEAYEIARAHTEERFDETPILIAVAPSNIMLQNIGGPPVVEGWFYRFKRAEDQPREFIVQVVNDQVSGSLQAEGIGDLPYEELPIDMNDVRFDSPEVFDMFEAVAEEREISTQGVIFDLELINLANTDGPVWNVVDPETFERIYSVSAVSGEEVENPYEPYQ
jgi:hypothetical protein